MADDERRAEIEAVARDMCNVPWKYAGLEHRERLLDNAERAIAALDRVRDARGDDEAHDRLVAGLFHDLTNLGRERDHLKAEVKRLRSAARSPQGEDHEAGIESLRYPLTASQIEESRAAPSPARDGTERVLRWALEDLRAGDVESASLRLTGLLGGIPPSPIAPSRDGTVAVEDVARWLSTRTGFLTTNDCLNLVREFLAEFASPASTGDRAPGETEAP